MSDLEAMVPELRSKVYEVIRVEAWCQITAEALKVRYEVAPMIGEHLVFALHQKMLSRTTETGSIAVPATWWDHMKRDLLSRVPLIGRWFTAWRREETVTQQTYICPHWLVPPDASSHFTFMDYGPDWYEQEKRPRWLPSKPRTYGRIGKS